MSILTSGNNSSQVVKAETKNIVLVGKEQVACVVNESKKHVVVDGTDTTNALLTGVRDVLVGVKDNSDTSEAIVNIYVPGLLKGLVYGTVTSYIRTGVTGTGAEIGEVNLALYKEVMSLYADKCFNVVFKDLDNTGNKTDAQKKLTGLKQHAWKVIEKEATTRSVVKAVGSVQAPVDPNAKTRELLNAQLEKALSEANMDQAQMVMTMIASLGSAAVQEQAPVVANTKQQTQEEQASEME